MSAGDGLYKRGGVWWLTKDPVTGKRGTTKCKSKPAAVEYRTERERLAANPHYAASYQATVGKWAVELVRMKTQAKSAGTADMYVTKTGHVRRIFRDDCPMVDVNPGSVDRYVTQRREEGAADNTIDKELVAIRQMCKSAKRAGEWAGDLDDLRPEDFSANYTPRDTTLTLEQVRTLFAALTPERVAATALAIAVGARRAEVQRIRREDIDLAAWTVRIPGTKTKASKREIPISLPAQRALLQLAAESGHLPVSWRNMSKDIPKMCLRVGIPRATPNDLRRSFATWGVEAGVSREDVAKLMGHVSTAMIFKVYGRESAGALGAKILRAIGENRSVGTSAAQYEFCLGGPGAHSSAINGVSDGDRTRDNRSHNPARYPCQLGETSFVPATWGSDVAQDDPEYPGVRTKTTQREGDPLEVRDGVWRLAPWVPLAALSDAATALARGAQ